MSGVDPEIYADLADFRDEVRGILHGDGGYGVSDGDLLRSLRTLRAEREALENNRDEMWRRVLVICLDSKTVMRIMRAFNNLHEGVLGGRE